jgi:hypothetical protein
LSLFLSLYVFLFGPLKILSSFSLVIIYFAGKFVQNDLYFGTSSLVILEPR